MPAVKRRSEGHETDQHIRSKTRDSRVKRKTVKALIWCRTFWKANPLSSTNRWNKFQTRRFSIFDL